MIKVISEGEGTRRFKELGLRRARGISGGEEVFEVFNGWSDNRGEKNPIQMQKRKIGSYSHKF